MEVLGLPISAYWIEPLLIGVQILLILLAGYVLQRIVGGFLTGLGERYPLPPELLVPVRGGLRWLIMGSAFVFVLGRLGVSATVLWTALSWLRRRRGGSLLRHVERVVKPALRHPDLHHRPVPHR